MLNLNVYVPDSQKDKKTFFSGLESNFEKLNISANSQNILVGDWNCIFDISVDKAGGRSVSNNIVTKEMKDIIVDLDLIDIWRIHNPLKKRFTFRQKTPLIQTRLDYFLVSSKIADIVLKTDIILSAWSDHSGISLKLNYLPPWPKGKGNWKFNATYIDDEAFVTNMNSKLDKWITFYSDVQDKRVKWDLIKYEIRKFCIDFGKEKKSQNNILTGNLLKSLNNLETDITNNTTDKLKEYEQIKSQLKVLETEQAKGVIIRAKAKWIEEGEKPTNSFMTLRKIMQ